MFAIFMYLVTCYIGTVGVLASVITDTSLLDTHALSAIDLER